MNVEYRQQILKCFLFVGILHFGENQFLTVGSDENLVNDCLEKIVSKYYQPEMKIVVVDSDISLSFPIIIRRSLKKFTIFKYDLPEMYIINVTNSKLEEIFDDLEIFNSRAYFIIICETSEDIFQNLSRYYVHKVILLDSDLNLQTYDPYVSEDATAANITPYVLGSCKNIPNQDFFKKTFPLFWRNTTVKAVYKSHFPYLYHDGGKFFGENYQLSKVLIEKLKFQLIMTEIGESTDFFDLLQKRKNHLITNLQSVNWTKYLKFDVIEVDMSAHFFWVVPPGIRVPFWKIFLLQFDYTIWVCLLICLLLLTLVWQYIQHTNLTHSFFLHYQLLFESGNFSIIRITKIPGRILALISIFSFLVISTTFKSEMLHSFTKNVYEYPVDNMDDIFRHNLKCYVAEDMKELFKSVSDYYDRLISKCVTIEEHADQQDVLLRVALQKDVATISRVLKLRFAENTLLEMGREEDTPHLLPRQVKFEFLFLYLTKGFPLYERICEVIRRLDAGGFTAYFRKIVDFKIKKALKTNKKIHTRNVTFAHVSIVFYVHLAGLGVGLGVFLAEIVVGTRRQIEFYN